MKLTRIMVYKFVVSVALLAIIACAEKKIEPQSDTIRICDENGCADRPKDYSSFNPESTVPPAEKAKIKALEDMAANNPAAAYDLGLRYFRGDGVRQDSYKAIKWMRDSAEHGYLEAQKALGRLYLTGLAEMGADPGEAERWLSITASRGDKEGARLLQEATAARQANQEDYDYYKKWRTVVQEYWYNQNLYRWRWDNGRWITIYY
ncbi:tetratricopeptide repeat protein [Methylocucumis oryzae]|uniref:Sel1 repeat-containing protein n=1 Tax=Methylocucumis oryzae TaxID=1632867 RepID=A0A0F3ILX2_9GAMM|nr:SEL1-like repeat protein [Methylocucumis oryzae]KJV07736.1 Sel1 repeat-containing protein [Methylocucumis oryzae]